MRSSAAASCVKSNAPNEIKKISECFMRAVRVWFRVIACRETSVAREVRQVRQKQCGGKVSKCNEFEPDDSLRSDLEVGRTKRSVVPAPGRHAGTALRLVRPTEKGSDSDTQIELRQFPVRTSCQVCSQKRPVEFLPNATRTCTVLIDEVEIREYDARQRTALCTDDEARNLALDPETGHVTEN